MKIKTSFDIVLPEDGASFPKNIVSPEFEWEAGDNNVWLIRIDLPDGSTLKISSKNNYWVPEADVWEKIKSSSENKYFKFTVFGHDGEVLSRSERFHFRISPYDIDRYIIYRLAPLSYGFYK
ncbi:MAG: hypothetical protein JRF25_07220 [Deltaproteobacteria bacterium]|nr:hypothetical protein [Deltaproteobacteria bacterium]